MGRLYITALLALLALPACRDEGWSGGSAPIDARLPDAALDATPITDACPAPCADRMDAAAPAPDAATVGPPVFRLTLLHVNDGASDLLPDGDIGGAPRFVTRLRQLQAAAPPGPGSGRLTVGSGDDFLAGPVFGASLSADPPYYEARVSIAGGLDVLGFGNHDFDFGPAVVARYVESLPARFVAANLDFGDEPALRPLVEAGRVAPWTVVETGGARVGLVGLIDPTLAEISSPGGARVTPPIAALQGALDALAADGVDIVILIGHLESLEAEQAVVAATTGVDVVVAGSEDDLFAGPDARLLPGDVAVDPYPFWSPDARGRPVPFVTTAGGYRYIGRLVADFDAEGRLVRAEGDPVRVIGGDADDAVEPDPETAAAVVEPVEVALDALAAEQIGFSEVALQGRARDLRRRETNLGDLVADALLWRARDHVFDLALERPDIALINGGAIRNNSILPPGILTELDTFRILPFASFVSLITVSRAELHAIFENAVSRVEDGDGRFAQVAGLSLHWHPARAARRLSETGELIEPGRRVVALTLDDGTRIVRDGVLLDGPPVTVATIDFLARGGDGYPFPPGARSIGISYQQALRDYVAGALEGEIGADDYPAAGTGRIIESQ